MNDQEHKQFEELLKAPWQEVFYDSCTQDWKENWTLDGLKAKVVNGPQGMDFSAGPVDREEASHAVLWTKGSFQGDVKIEYEYTRTDNANRWTTILFIQATGIDKGLLVKDITQWADIRTVPLMKLYHSGMHLYHISCAAFEPDSTGPGDTYMRARRYSEKGLEDSGFAPDYLHTGLFEPGVPHRLTAIKKGNDLYMFVKNPTRELLCHWDTSSKPPITEGHIGLRHMYTRAARYRDFRISVLNNKNAE